MIETILEEIRGLNLPLFWLTESEHGKAHDMELCAGQSVQRHLFRYEVFTVTALGFLYDQGL